MWDLRVDPAFRSRGVGRMLWEHAVRHARDCGCTELKVETQNINVPACRFYASRGCMLSDVDPTAYPDLPHEVQLSWRLQL